MSDRPSHNLDGLDIGLARRIDEACRRFEADWREGHQPCIEDHLVDVSPEGRPARCAGRDKGDSAECHKVSAQNLRPERLVAS